MAHNFSNKDERSVEKSFDILSKYEEASGSRINYNKTKAISIGTAHHLLYLNNIHLV
jgi:hypothetical protein